MGKLGEGLEQDSDSSELPDPEQLEVEAVTNEDGNNHQGGLSNHDDDGLLDSPDAGGITVEEHDEMPDDDIVDDVDVEPPIAGPPVFQEEKRGSTRVHAPDLAVDYSLSNQSLLQSMFKGRRRALMIKNISADGLAIQTREELETGLMLDLRMKRLGGSIEKASARVVGCRPGSHDRYLVSLQLVDNSPLLEYLVEEALSRQDS